GQAGINETNGYNMPSNPRLFEILMLSWFANCIVPAKLGDGYRSYLLKRDAGAPGSTSIGTILAERIVDLSVLFITMTITGILAFHGDLPEKVKHTVWIGGAMIGLAAVALVVLLVGRDHVVRFIPDRFTRHFHDFHGAVFACLRRPALPILVSLTIWMCDGVRMWLVARSLGAHLSLELTLFVALMSALLTTLPFTPAGLGLVEAAVVVVLKLVDVDADMAGSIAILDRLIGYWSLILVGMIMYIIRVRRDLKSSFRES
ncbi:MAG TPA: lysylphosphatidylglycerol synthase transmembrane domain-containing protein, partial [Thermomicrobiales bacterium]|nr:lysylphosphatidylglycerol synthase transmembrane domain-containing protein [Thermomicrobiales bacterium]